MDAAAVEKAKRRLERARECLTEIERPPKTYADFQAAWTDFLLALNGIFSCLEQGAKISPQSRQWFGGKKRTRKGDGLMQYLHQARNTEEHGIVPVSKLKTPTVKLLEGTGNPDSVKSIEIHDDRVIIVHNPSEGKSPVISVTMPAAILVPVKDDRSGKVFDPPTEHLDQLIENSFPLTVSRLGFAYVENLIAEAEGLA